MKPLALLASPHPHILVVNHVTMYLMLTIAPNYTQYAAYTLHVSLNPWLEIKYTVLYNKTVVIGLDRYPVCAVWLA